MNKNPLWLLAGLPLLLLAADSAPAQHEVNLHIEGLDPQFLNHHTDTYTITKITDGPRDITLLLDQHTGRSWILALQGDNIEPSPGWIPLIFHRYACETTNRYNTPLSATTNTPPPR